jgi:hypothetical protein
MDFRLQGTHFQPWLGVPVPVTATVDIAVTTAVDVSAAFNVTVPEPVCVSVPYQHPICCLFV